MNGPRFARKKRPLLRIAVAVLAPAVVVFAVWLFGLVRFADGLPREVADPDRRTDAIVVLTGGSERLSEGFDLLARNMADKLYVSGVYRGVEVEELLRLSQRAPGDLECCVELGHSADDTAGNAAETADWVAANGYHSLRLVTGNYHMPRSLLEFRYLMPDIEIVPNPVFPKNVRHRHWWTWPGTARLIIGEYNKYLVARLRHLLVPRGHKRHNESRGGAQR
jgi:uncharacterized SAM-binding protein YcdF (DUF218 family)